MNKTINNLRKELKENVNDHTKNTTQRFFKEEIKIYGVKIPVVNSIAKRYFREIKELDKGEIFLLCEELFSSGYMEESFVACDWSYNLRESYEEKDFLIFEDWTKQYINNWAVCDRFCNHTMGSFLKKYPKYVKNLKEWTGSKNRWVRRASSVSLIIPAKKGEFLKDVFEIADLLLNDEDDLVQKGYGWLLKVASEINQKQVYDFVVARKDTMPRTAYRYAIEKMPVSLKKEAMKK
ncbi:MAG: DNA alkylation repair protein [Candidatus Dojkabacteria bacterium]